MATVAELLASASRHHQAGQRELAIGCLQAALRLNPSIPEAHSNLGMLFAQEGRLEEAVASFQVAVRLRPDYADAHNNLGNLLREQGHLETAVAHLQEALRLRPDHVEARHNLVIALQAQGKLVEADSRLERANPNPALPLTSHNVVGDSAEVYFQRGLTLAQQGRYDEAAANYQHTLRLRPNAANAHNNLGTVFLSQGKLPEAIDSYRQALRCNPHSVDASSNLGMVLWKLGKLDEALAQYQHALRLDPDNAALRNNLGAALQELGQLVEAEASLRWAVRVKPDFADAICNLGIVLWKQGRVDEAVAQYQHALHVQPDHFETYLNLGNALKNQGRLDDALDAFRKALRIKPNAADIHSNLVVTMNYHPGYDAQAMREECARWNQQHAEVHKKLIRPHANYPDPERRLRVGYVSPHFSLDVDSFFTIPLLSNHDHRHYEIVCYANVSRPDAMTGRVRGYSDVWRSTVGLSDQQVADLVRSDQIDILVDLELHTAKNRLLMFASKPAPVQVTWLGYPGTTGLSTMDYRLTDPYLDPPGLFDAFYSEESVRLPNTFWCYDPLIDGPPVKALPTLEDGVITFGCLNNFCKVNEGCLALWAEVLRKVPRSRLLLLAPRGQARDRVLAKLRKEKIAQGRIEFIDRALRQEYLVLYHRIDLGLDPFPYNGHTTSLDAFWMGVPVVTLVGKTVVGRAGWSQLCNLGLQELAAETPDQYVALAAELAGDLPRLQELRTTLRLRMEQSPLMDGKRFALNMEQAYRQVWRTWCNQAARGDSRKNT
jgi:predicted O-linked N-acetylglucosamine transferase (SPINDLY family)